MTNPSERIRKPTRVGPRMAAVARYVAINPGCVAMRAAEWVAPHGTGIGFGYRTVWRAVAAGLVCVEPGPRKGTYALYPATAGATEVSDG